MSDHRRAPDLLDELLGLDDPSFAEEDQAQGQPEAAAEEELSPRRRRWCQSKRDPVPPEGSEAEEPAPPENASDEPSSSPRRGWLSRRRTLLPEAPEAETDYPQEPAEPVVAEPEDERSAEHQEQPAAEEDPAGDDPQAEAGPDELASPRRLWRSRRRPPLPKGLETEPESAEEPELPSDEIARAPAPKRRGGRHLRGAGDEADADGSADASSDPSNLGRGDPVLPPLLGPRRTDRARRRSRNRLFVGVAGALLALAAAATLLDPSLRDDPQPESSGSAAPATEVLADPVRTLLVYGSREGQATEAAWMALLSLNSETREGSVVYVPAHTATEVPGRGLLGIGESLGSGPSLLEVSTETLLGVPVDDQLLLTPEAAEALFQGIGDVSVDVPSELQVPAGEGQARLLIPQGPQQLAPGQLVSLLFRPGIEGDDAELGGRHLALWNGVLSQYADDPDALASAVADAEPPLGTPAATDRIGAFLSDLARLPASSRILANLPVKEVSVGGDQLYETDPEELSAFVGETIGETDLAADLSRVQVLNGNGVPGIGVDVAEKLVGNGYQITLSGNADRLDYFKTRIVTYDSSPEGLAAARQAQALLGAGTVQVSSQGQGIVDLTIVVGRDFLRTR